jgi:formylglycine-generating enzyme required for sulfatase activity
MKRNISTPIVALFLTALSCGSFSQQPTADNVLSTPTQEKLLQTATEVQVSPAIPPITEFMDDIGIPMVLVPEGEFAMGGSAEDVREACLTYVPGICDFMSFGDEEPIHQVYLDAFYIDKFEVTNAQYRTCVEMGSCKEPALNNAPPEIENYYGDSTYDDFPVNWVDWDQAKNYCEWRGAKLPTEAQWEKAARGPDGRTYPWGSDGRDNPNSTFWIDEGGQFLDDVSPYGSYDMAGNVSEWVADWYLKDYYQNSPYSNPIGPDGGDYKVVRGGDVTNGYAFYGRTSHRSAYEPFHAFDYLGFRCVVSLGASSQQPSSESSTQQTMTQSPAYILPDYFYLSDAYKITKNEDGSIEFYTNLSFDEIEGYYRDELPDYGYTERFVDEPSPAEGCVRLTFDGDPSGKALVITDCIIFSTEEHAVAIGLIDK